MMILVQIGIGVGRTKVGVVGLLGRVVSEEVSGTNKREVMTGVGVGGTEVGGSGTAWIGVVSEEEMGATDRTDVQTQAGGGGTARTVVVF